MPRRRLPKIQGAATDVQNSSNLARTNIHSALQKKDFVEKVETTEASADFVAK